MSNLFNMNHSEPATNWNSDQGQRHRNSGTDNQYIICPYYVNVPNHHMMFNTNPITIAPVTEHSSYDSSSSGLTSPINSEKQTFTVDHWPNIASRYDGNSEDRPNCGKLKDDVYFTHRSGEVYLLFEKKTDYINHFINYYFSDRNLKRDTKLVALMDLKGAVPLSALIKFPKLNNVDTSVEDIVKAVQNSGFLCITETLNGEKAIKRISIEGKNGGYDSGFSTTNSTSGRLSSELGSAGDVQHQQQQQTAQYADSYFNTTNHQHSISQPQHMSAQPPVPIIYLPQTITPQVPNQSHPAAFPYQTTTAYTQPTIVSHPHVQISHHQQHNTSSVQQSQSQHHAPSGYHIPHNTNNQPTVPLNFQYMIPYTANLTDGYFSQANYLPYQGPVSLPQGIQSIAHQFPTMINGANFTAQHQPQHQQHKSGQIINGAGSSMLPLAQMLTTQINPPLSHANNNSSCSSNSASPPSNSTNSVTATAVAIATISSSSSNSTGGSMVAVPESNCSNNNSTANSNSPNK